MRWKTTVVLLVATVSLGAYVARDIRQPSDERREELSRQLIDAPAEQITQIAIDAPRGHATLTKRGTDWALAPDGARANPDFITRLSYYLTPLTADRVLAPSKEHPLDLKAMGLAPATARIGLMANRVPTIVQFGNATALQGKRYANVLSRPEVFVIPSGLFDAINQPREAFRDPLLVRFNSWEAAELTVITSAATVSLSRADQQWRLTQPIAEPADASAANALVAAVGDLPIKRYVDDAPRVERISALGLDRPTAEVRLRPEAHAPPIAMFFGAPLPDDASLRYAKRSDEPALYAVAGDDVERVLKSAEAVREKRAATSAAPANQAAGATEALKNGQMSQHGKERERPPEQVMPQGPPRKSVPRQQSQ